MHFKTHSIGHLYSQSTDIEIEGREREKERQRDPGRERKTERHRDTERKRETVAGFFSHQQHSAHFKSKEHLNHLSPFLPLTYEIAGEGGHTAVIKAPLCPSPLPPRV